MIDRRRSEWSQRCSVCTHPQRERIELAMARGAGRRVVAQTYDASADAIYRHWRDHVPEPVKAARRADVLKPGMAIEQALKEEGDLGQLEHLRVLRAGLFRQFDLAVETNDSRSLAPLAAQLIKIASIVGEQTGELRRSVGSAPTVNQLIVSPDFIRFRATILRALKPYPDAMAAVMAALSKLDLEEAPAIEAKALEVVS
jgi:hypothetical protein